ncbi:MAG: phosphatidylglycerophosphatase A [candidate division Zixibacteria bacterium]|nr:phosphatidylglycerophosphatase A [candidate division Zixibacteria bacterium]MDD5426082.1 phosphatidylglycerophosphatase A [candidate division Zixibacteria bacterium]
MKEKLAIILATGFGWGFFPVVAGTVGTIPAWLVAFYLVGDKPLVLSLLTIITFIIAVWSAGVAEKIYGHDAKKIVIDEWAGMFVTLLFLPFSLTSYLVAFFAFRFFDVAKIPPASQMERLPRGWGITLDDIAAGIYANLLTRLIIYFIDKY